MSTERGMSKVANTRGPVRLMFGLIGTRRKVVIAALIIGVFASAASVSQPLLIGQLVGQIHSESVTQLAVVLLVGVFLVEAVLLGAQSYLLGLTGSRIVQTLRRRLASTLMRAPLSEHVVRRRGDTQTRVVTDTAILRSSITQAFAVLVLSGLTVVGAVVIMFMIDVVLTLLLLACLSITAVVSLLLSQAIRRATRTMLNRVSDFGSALQRALGGITTVKLSRAEDREAERIGGYADQAFVAGMRSITLTSLMTPASNAGVQASFGIVFTVGAMRLASGDLGIGLFASFLLLLFYMITPLITIFTSLAQLQQGMAAAGRLTEILELPDEADLVTTRGAAEVGSSAETVGGRNNDEALLRVRDLTFAYSDNVPVLRDVSFDIPDRGVTALVGPSGAGKSTIFALLERLWTLDEGSITLDGVEISQLPLDDVRRRIAMVEQEAAVLDSSIKENLLYAAPDATEEQLASAVRQAHLQEWIDGLPDGMDTLVGEEGETVSGGQRQRIAIARMLLLRPEIVLLDEVTAHLDGFSEGALGEAIKDVAQQRAVVVIAHRLSTIIDADRILVLDDGRIRAQGRHRELISQDPVYERLVRVQDGRGRRHGTEHRPDETLVAASAAGQLDVTP